MKVMTTLEGGLRVECEDEGDWKLLQYITHDALGCDENLARRLARLIEDQDVAGDWHDFILPELEEGFHADLTHVATAIASARVECGGSAGPLWITRDDALRWYSALNQARLALEEIHHFGPAEDLHPDELPPSKRNTFLRSQFYCAIQSLLLEHVMK